MAGGATATAAVSIAGGATIAGGAVTSGGATGAENAFIEGGGTGSIGPTDADCTAGGVNAWGLGALGGAASTPRPASRGPDAGRMTIGANGEAEGAAGAIARGANGSTPPPATAVPTDARGVSAAGRGVDDGADGGVLGGSVLLMRGES